MTTTATPPTRPRRTGPMDSRRADLAQIHQLAKELALQDDAYRDLMATVCGGIRSAALLDVSGRQRFIAHLRRCQGKPEQRLQGKGIARPLSGHEKLMWSLWMRLADLGAVEQRSMAALCAFAQRQTGVGRVEWLNNAQQHAVIEALKQWVARLKSEARP